MMAAPTPLTAYQQTYHWRNKNCAPWAYEWIKKTLPGTGVGGVVIDEVIAVSGDCDLGQRKGKLLTIYDLVVEMSWKGTLEDGTEVKGKVNVPEVSHETIDGLTEYTYNFRLTSPDTPEAQAYFAIIRKSLPPILSEKFNALRPALLAEHGAALSEAAAAASGSGTSTPDPTSTTYTPAPPAKDDIPKPKAEKKEGGVGATATVEVKADLRASADDLWSLLTDEKKIPMWSRGPAKMPLKPEEQFELFAGFVKGKIISVDPPKKLVQTWQAQNSQWPSNHYATMTMSLVQGSESTSATFVLEHVPVGCQADIERALDTYYIRGLKQMGLGTFL
ncbi:hypothetical protein TREMEDRAFT_38360 [Tremella mesenterica DSM 1558]|uniref:uncharacterized protein n=1 Tax=Tremella mesenterica (strain ATCC 24925 / CBS 8224 / DSM 1558 / NBRC 9311 / NRRL Y-6157 / RJB 2259-6 / UBC 559-6) TaxID=578456 RepID=UPI0003F49843|nr:uncharacterized protein TREMEDRAFT_38360 [Tremella mesenterica DSM 1558]EIW70718.1 hypothetical protein TREMEDRAFT_38360 [Tremella mesenterica DSM 1558]